MFRMCQRTAVTDQVTEERERLSCDLARRQMDEKQVMAVLGDPRRPEMTLRSLATAAGKFMAKAYQKSVEVVFTCHITTIYQKTRCSYLYTIY